MRVLGFDPGAKRMGWSCLEATPAEVKENKPPIVHGSAVFGLDQGSNESSDETFQQYRIRLIDLTISETEELLHEYRPDVVVGEIVPAVGGGNFRGGAVQSQLAETAITTVFVVARSHAIPVAQVGATSVKARIGGGRKATKVGVRNGIYRIIPSYRTRWQDPALKKLKHITDEADAVGVSLTHLGYDLRKK